MHCYFVLAGDSAIPVLYHVERVREGRSFLTRTVQARQRGRCIFTTTMSFVREGSAGDDTVDHEVGFPPEAREELEKMEILKGEVEREEVDPLVMGPFEYRMLPILNGEFTRTWELFRFFRERIC